MSVALAVRLIRMLDELGGVAAQLNSLEERNFGDEPSHDGAGTKPPSGTRELQGALNDVAREICALNYAFHKIGKEVI